MGFSFFPTLLYSFELARKKIGPSLTGEVKLSHFFFILFLSSCRSVCPFLSMVLSKHGRLHQDRGPVPDLGAMILQPGGRRSRILDANKSSLWPVPRCDFEVGCRRQADVYFYWAVVDRGACGHCGDAHMPISRLIILPVGSICPPFCVAYSGESWP